MLFFVFSAFLAFTGIVCLAYLLCSKQSELARRIDRSAELSFYLSCTVSMISLIWALSDLSDFNHSGAGIAFSLLLLLYASMLKVATLLLLKSRSDQQ